MTLPMTPAAAVRTEPVVAAGPTDDAGRVARMLADIDDLVVTFRELRQAHLMDAGGPLLESFTRLSVALDMDGNEIRHIRNLLGGNA